MTTDFSLIFQINIPSSQIRNGESDLSPFLLLNPDQGEHQNGRLCRSSIPPPRNTSSNLLRIDLKANGDSDVGSGFK